jgi:hypothetical protein
MCIVCEHELWEEHRALEREFFKPCKKCKKFPGGSCQGTCYHCFAIGNTIDECPECVGKLWSQEFLEAKEKIEGPRQGAAPVLAPAAEHRRSFWGHASPLNPVISFHQIEMPIAAQERQRMLPAQRRNPNVIGRNRFALPL